jgi:two-component system response regulator MprA
MSSLGGTMVRKPRVLTVDDDPDQRKLIMLALRDTCEVMEAEDSQQALDLVRAHAFDYILTDSNLPEFDGLHLCQALRDTYGDRHAIIFVSASGDQPAFQQKSRYVEANAIVPKPFLRENLYEALAQTRQEFAGYFSQHKDSRALRLMKQLGRTIAKRHSAEDSSDDPSHE